MAWSEEQKARARVDLARRKAFETSASYRASCFKALAATAGCILALVVGGRDLDRQQDWFRRVPDMIFIAAMLAAGAIASSLAYIRFLDWRRKLAEERGPGGA